MNKTLKDSLDVIWYFMAFFLIQFIMIWAVRIGTNLATGQPLIDAANAASRPNGDALVLMMLFSSILTILVFGQFRWSPWSRDYLRSKPWLVVVWTIILSLGTILPSEWILESLQVRMSEAQVQMFEQIMGKPMGYIAIGILAPIAEEMCFRGAILRKLLTMFPKRQHWIAIAVSAVLFALAHFNVVQSLHAFLIGLLLGWLYYRTDSILPGIVFHWINNTVAYVMFNIMPQMADGKLIDLFHGNSRMVTLSVIFSFFILIPSIYQLNVWMKRAK